ncbi:hypothetical protein GMA12_17830 [Kocuria sediminis]|uniref:Uncharacterized protein n=1 Tax=Kocuria sediminis TaxID=1038857 RepID=A0A6N8GQB9_9MICC|nr:hypothetical protein [Kocuria sediminis]MUN64660.1 hypothetical protein [Kocuria sediminis]MUN64979.1 hypothetical protein [Kocuria sediminis]
MTKSPQESLLSVSEEELAHLRRFLIKLDHSLASFDPMKMPPAVHAKTSLAGDDKHMGGWPISMFAHSGLVATAGNLASLRDLIVIEEGDGHVQVRARAHGPFALVRAALESAAQVAWVMSPHGRYERIARRWALRHDELQMQQYSMEDYLEDSKLKEIAQRDIEKLGRARARMRELIDGTPSLTWRQVRNQDSKWTSLFKDLEARHELFQDVRLLSIWRICSGLSHSKEWAGLHSLTHKPLEGAAEAGSADSLPHLVGMDYETLSTYGSAAAFMMDLAVSLYRRGLTVQR